MYRQHENPRDVARMVMEEQEKLAQMILDGEADDAIIDQKNYVEELKERENFAWQDEEYDENYALYGA